MSGSSILITLIQLAHSVSSVDTIQSARSVCEGHRPERNPPLVIVVFATWSLCSDWFSSLQTPTYRSADHLDRRDHHAAGLNSRRSFSRHEMKRAAALGERSTCESPLRRSTCCQQRSVGAAPVSAKSVPSSDCNKCDLLEGKYINQESQRGGV